MAEVAHCPPPESQGSCCRRRSTQRRSPRRRGGGCKSDTLIGIAKEYVLPESTVFTDDFSAYGGFGARFTDINTAESITAKRSTWLATRIPTRSMDFGCWSKLEFGASTTTWDSIIYKPTLTNTASGTITASIRSRCLRRSCTRSRSGMPLFVALRLRLSRSDWNRGTHTGETHGQRKGSA